MVTKQEILDIARLSRLYVAPEELEALTQNMQQMIAFADTINAAGAAGDDGFDNIGGLSNVLRDDEVVESWDRDEILKNVDGGEDGYFPVRKRG